MLNPRKFGKISRIIEAMVHTLYVCKGRYNKALHTQTLIRNISYREQSPHKKFSNNNRKVKERVLQISPQTNSTYGIKPSTCFLQYVYCNWSSYSYVNMYIINILVCLTLHKYQSQSIINNN